MASIVYCLFTEGYIPRYARNVERARALGREMVRERGQPVTLLQVTLNDALSHKDLLVACLNKENYDIDRRKIETFKPQPSLKEIADRARMMDTEDVSQELGTFPPEDEEDDDGSDLVEEGQ